jgi:hypothetical protein
MKLPIGKSPVAERPKPVEKDEVEPHIFQELLPGGDICSVCRSTKGNLLHRTLDSKDSPRWGF